MRFLKNGFSLLVFLLFAFSAVAQVENPVKWTFSYSQKDNSTIEVYADAEIEEGWHLYSAYLPENGPVPTSLKLIKSDLFQLDGSVIEQPKPKIQFDNSFQIELGYFENKARLIQKIKISEPTFFEIKGEVEFMLCNDEQCLPPDITEFSISIKPKKVEKSKLSETTPPKEDLSIKGGVHRDDADQDEVVNEKELLTQVDTIIEEKAEEQLGDMTLNNSVSENHESYWSIFFLAFLGGLAALLTPCVFPMIPMTVSFFTKQSHSRASGIKNALIYGISIVLIYVVLGVFVTAIFGADSLNALSTNPIFNLFFALLLIVFAISFFGAFEIVLPSSWVNAADKKADKGGLIGIFFMAFTLALVSFSCTGPIVGGLIVQAAREGGMAPVIGMLGFSLAIAIPFFFFAAFPGYLNSLPKSGGWLNSVKVVLGFLELAFAFKFLSIADMVLDLHILEREIFIAIWIAIFGAMGFYLLGAIKLPHDSPLERIPVSRFMLALIVFGFTIYLIPGLWGAPVKLISGFPPPKEYAESPFGLGNESSTKNIGFNVQHNNSLPDGMHYGPQGILVFDDYNEALKYANEVKKPLLLDFTGKGCVNCRKMEDNVWSDEAVKSILTNDYIVVSLYVDLRTDLPKEQQYVSPATGKKIKTIGNKWSDFQITRFHRNSQPHYVILDGNENELLPFKAYDLDVIAYKKWLIEGVEKYKLSIK
ncbi:MAG: thioredoxin family protein [Marinilabiliaceae bacterium]|nr:thioredoxin family protein [Marinilabiliaceae bacterium]